MNIIITHLYNQHNNQLKINGFRDHFYPQCHTASACNYPSIMPIDNVNSWYISTKIFLLLVEKCLKLRPTGHLSAACVDKLKCNVIQDAAYYRGNYFHVIHGINFQRERLG